MLVDTALSGEKRGESCWGEAEAPVEEALMAEVGIELGCVLGWWEVWTWLGRGRRNREP